MLEEREDTDDSIVPTPIVTADVSGNDMISEDMMLEAPVAAQGILTRILNICLVLLSLYQELFAISKYMYSISRLRNHNYINFVVYCISSG